MMEGAAGVKGVDLHSQRCFLVSSFGANQEAAECPKRVI